MSDDEFGDPGWMDGVDLDAIAAAAEGKGTSDGNGKKKAIEASTSTSTGTAATNKRRKVSISPTNRKMSTDNSQEALEKTLLKFFGYSKFRKGQLQVIQQVLQQDANSNDTAVFWATGSGKSLCYQIPALHTQRITLVLSPLVSLMNDQVHSLNGLMTGNNGNTEIATFLGSGQTDKSKEHAAIQEGKFPIIYLTPEKLLSAGFLQQLERLHTTTREIGLIAIDESHCVSDWGHDFRPEYSKIGQVLRNNTLTGLQHLKQIPIMALTATAVPRVQQDICQSLLLKNPYTARQSSDRNNLIISVHKKDRGMALSAAMEPLIQTLVNSKSHQHQQSTIIYAPTRNLVEEITSFLRQRLAAQENIQVEGYHAGMPNAQRSAAHTNFLTGKTTVICGTSAFGLGINKIDTRRVIHYGPPKTVEEYYQQIGRAGRDGIQAECTMYVSEAEFNSYKSDFYIGKLSGNAKQAVLESIDALKEFSLDTTTCRRKSLLTFFKERPSFGERCGTCDNCQKHKTMDSRDLERDFPMARVVLTAIQALDGPSVSTIQSAISGKKLESYRYKPGVVEYKVKEAIQKLKDEAGQKISLDGYREFIVPLQQRGFLRESSKSSTVSGYQRTWTTYSITEKGVRVLRDQSLPIVLPVPAWVLEAERIEKERRQRVLKQLEDSGVEIDKLPQEECEAGDGDVIRAYSKWHSYLKSMKDRNNEDRVAQLELLLASVEQWRAAVAIKHRMAPGAVLAEHTMLTVTYTTATLPPAMTLKEDDLIAAGVRTREIASLCKALTEWRDTHRSAKEDAGQAMKSASKTMDLTPGQSVKGTRQWEYAVYKVIKKTGLASWESSYLRFQKGESPTTIAMSPANGKPIQVKTVCGHVMTALLHGREVDLHRLATCLPPPTAQEWERLQEAEIEVRADVCGNPLNSGAGGVKLTKTELLRPIMGSAFVDTPYNERGEEEKANFSMWCDLLEWYMSFKRVGIEPSFKDE
ncbi:syndrome ATP-dependent helicase homolog [Seminavis robusta]|uniref:ATP-dependent DNA helicase n=1 Tax=Seminavis robusta TaxID=568900 RepID=A0A9N8DEC6_9STRA|nr:syndrome ATP-dependent helicase homolog [Seminavis robusta]|eukprot:Sro83_g044440.1 syndrome ATP-dependent helicase homolog (979) ;mRNA; f:84808-87944